ncbi:RNA polymerase sigma-70 factor, ECF subfamily [Sinosporangium album]|uniref:RNA polymerase sigma-70 factor, ECF subfamily n=1 Tax=Sinosporangium album TaxID=504805 RepID=A0A1G8G7K4_9ACTN|nr:RNA polymerase sigma factor [Sinosporangium album]SDH90290.1 RNA polymerase sigma-70 factor, ECF subfamily [Sinosporangium album]
MSEQDDRFRFEAVYRRTYEQILGYAVRRCSSPEDAADVVAETYVIAWRRITELPDGEAGKLWLYGVARRVLANHRRSEQRRLTTTFDQCVCRKFGAHMSDQAPMTLVTASSRTR